ncbi:MAG: HAD-IA family hydrolase, partial [Bacteroidota bacterium]
QNFDLHIIDYTFNTLQYLKDVATPEYIHNLYQQLSGDEKMAKPDKEIFFLLLNRYQLHAEDCLFIDDNSNNISTAKEMGFHTIHFTDEVNLRQRLKQMQLL